jgi:hypothetical protein
VIKLIKINGAWYLESLPQHIVIELEDGSLTKVFINPFRVLQERDFTVYNAYHPRKCKGSPLPDYLYRFYGLEKNDETASEMVRGRITPTEKAAYKQYLDRKGVTESEDLRQYVRDCIRGAENGQKS